METLFVLGYWPLIGVLMALMFLRLSSMGVGWRWRILACGLAGGVAGGCFTAVVLGLGLHGRLLHSLGFLDGRTGWGYTLLMGCSLGLPMMFVVVRRARGSLGEKSGH
jgi:hypothetical protein